MYVTGKASLSDKICNKNHQYEETYNHLKVLHVDSNDRDM